MSRRRRVRRWIYAWRRLVWFGKMLQDLHERGLTVSAFLTEGAPMTLKATPRDEVHWHWPEWSLFPRRQRVRVTGGVPQVVGRSREAVQEGGVVKVFLDDEELGNWESQS